MAMPAWTYREQRVEHLSCYVDFLWYFEGPTAHHRKRIFPNGKVELLVNMGEPYRMVVGRGSEWLTTGCLSGLQSGPMVVEQPAQQRVLGIRLRPAGAYAVLASPMREISGLVVDLEDFFGRAARELVGRCQEAATVDERFRVATRWVAKHIQKARKATPEVAWSASCIESTGGDVSIRELRRETGLSKTRMASAFRDEIGLAPKLYARVVRFHHVLKMLQDGRAPLADVALSAAYYDQPHMTAEFRELGGITPREFLAGRHPVGDGSTAADRLQLADVDHPPGM
jgi:AraC-like DNA-binding protein